MSYDKLLALLRNGENEQTEFKRILLEKDLSSRRRSKLIAQIKFITSQGEGTFVIGVEDLHNKKWVIYGLSEEQLSKSEEILDELCNEAGVKIVSRERIETDKGYIGLYKLSSEEVLDEEIEMIPINVVGRVNAGKSSLIGALVTGRNDNGKGLTRSYLLTYPQEIVKGQTADLHLLFLAFDHNKKPILLKNPLSHDERAAVIGRAKRIITFFDAPGHEEFSKTMIRSILGSSSQYGLVLIPVDDEYELIQGSIRRLNKAQMDGITREHLILMLSSEIPFLILLTKVDAVDNDKIEFVKSVLKDTLKRVGRVPFSVRNEDDLKIALRELNNNVIVPIMEISSVTGKNMGLLLKFLSEIGDTIPKHIINQPGLAYIDKIYRGIPGVSVVVSGTVLSGNFKTGQEIKIGPDENGTFHQGAIGSIEVFSKRVFHIKAGDVFGASIKKVEPSILRRGQVIADVDYPLSATREFEANILVTKHPTRITLGYNPVLQCRTIQQTVELLEIYDKDYLVVGEMGRVRLKFKYYPEFLLEGDKIVLREANTRAIGTITKKLD